jgi:hypothetical protein
MHMLSLLTLYVLDDLPIADSMRTHSLLVAGAARCNDGAFPEKKRLMLDWPLLTLLTFKSCYAINWLQMLLCADHAALFL